MTAERVKRQLTAVRRLTGRAAPTEAHGVGFLGCPYWAAGTPRWTEGPYGGLTTASYTLRMKLLVSLWIAVAVFLLISIGASTAQPRPNETAARPKTIFVLHSYGQNFEPWATWVIEMRHELARQALWPLDFQEHSLVTARDGDSNTEAKFVEYLAARHARRPPDLIGPGPWSVPARQDGRGGSGPWGIGCGA